MLAHKLMNEMRRCIYSTRFTTLSIRCRNGQLAEEAMLLLTRVQYHLTSPRVLIAIEENVICR
jgi:hypothetical protein